MTSSQLAEHCTGIAEVMGSTPAQSLNFFVRLYFHCCSGNVQNCDDQLHLQFTKCIQESTKTVHPFMSQVVAVDHIASYVLW